MNNILKTSSVQLVEIDKAKQPIGVASGCLISCEGNRVLLTVRHATGDFGNWAIQLDYSKDKGTKLYQLGSMYFAKKLTLPKAHVEDIDFSYAKIPNDLEVVRWHGDPSGNGNEIGRDIINTYPYTLNLKYDKNDTYGFCGAVMAENVANPVSSNRPFLKSEIRCYENLTLIREEGDYLVFKLPFRHPGHEHFQGCSGAPIISSKNEPVALVCHGDEETGEIYGISLNKMGAVVVASMQEEARKKP